MDKRNYYIDMFRGILVISMVLYHLFYDMVYMFNYNIEFFRVENVRLWQILGSVPFVIISGVSLRFYSDYKKRGGLVFLLGLLITIVTYFVNKNEYVIFGILSLIGTSIIIVGFFEKYLVKLNKYFGTVLFSVLSIIFFPLKRGYINLGFKYYLNDVLYSSNLGFLVGLPNDSFRSIDYFPLIPWFFIFLVGFYLGYILKEKGLMRPMGRQNILSWIGQRSLIIYVLHQVVIYGVLYILN